MNERSKYEYTPGTKDCPRHKVIMVSSELEFANRFGHGDPIRHIYLFTCEACGQRGRLTVRAEVENT